MNEIAKILGPKTPELMESKQDLNEPQEPSVPKKNFKKRLTALDLLEPFQNNHVKKRFVPEREANYILDISEDEIGEDRSLDKNEIKRLELEKEIERLSKLIHAKTVSKNVHNDSGNLETQSQGTVTPDVQVPQVQVQKIPSVTKK